MAEWMEIAYMLVPIVSVLAFGLFCSVIGNRESEREIDMPIFLATVAIGIGVLIWTGMMDIYWLVVSVLCMIGIIFSRGD